VSARQAQAPDDLAVQRIVCAVLQCVQHLRWRQLDGAYHQVQQHQHDDAQRAQR
jgi:hypothetical protein